MKHNSVQLIGYVGDYPKITTLKNGTRKATLRVATHDSFDRKDKTELVTTVWHDVVAWDDVAEYAERSFVKASQILVEGMLVYGKFTDKSGKLCHVVNVRAISLKNLDR